MKRTIDHCKVIYYHGRPEQHDGMCTGVVIDGNLFPKCIDCYLRDNTKTLKVCAECGKEFASTSATVKFCSKECKNKHNKRAKAKKAKPKPKTLEETLKDLDEYNRTHDKYLTYGKYKEMLFLEELKNESKRK